MGWVKPRRQQGLTLVQVSVVLVAAVLIVVVATVSWHLYKDWRAAGFRSDLSQMESWLWQFKDRKQRWPGDCDRDGIIGYEPPHSRIADEVPSRAADPDETACGHGDENHQDTVFSDLRLSGIVSSSSTNDELAAHRFGGHFLVGSGAAEGTLHNVIVAYRVPTWAAWRLDRYYDGVEGGDAGRIRRWDAGVSGGPWPKDAESDEKVAVAFFFDKPLPAKDDQDESAD